MIRMKTFDVIFYSMMFIVLFVVMLIKMDTLKSDIVRRDLKIKRLECSLKEELFKYNEQNKYLNIVDSVNRVTKNASLFEIYGISKIISDYADKYKDKGLTVGKILSLIEIESAFDVKAIGQNQDYGLMQCRISTFNYWLPKLGYGYFTKEKALHPFINLHVGIHELMRIRQYWLDQKIDDWLIVFAMYNWGEQNTKNGKATVAYALKIMKTMSKWEKKGLK